MANDHVTMTDRQPPGNALGADNYLNHTHGWRSWLFTLDHKRIGVMYLVSILTSFLLGGVLALLVRTELMTPQRTIMSADTYNQVFTLHGAVMIFRSSFMGSGGAGNFVLPISWAEGRRSSPNLLSYHLWMPGRCWRCCRSCSARSTPAGRSTRRTARPRRPRSFRSRSGCSSSVSPRCSRA
jgi:cytochrome c oxidase subunit 1